ncbi:MAG: hypothetical protein PHG35_07825 [Dehalococcoidales bacterium]|nr:hypothetical protein [Dehalococcoidales bacterium]
MISESTRLKLQAAGRKGGEKRYADAGAAGMAEMGRSGGRPRVDLAERLRRANVPENVKNIEGGMIPNGIKSLKGLMRSCGRSNSLENKSGEPGSPQLPGSPTGGKEVERYQIIGTFGTKNQGKKEAER